MSKDKSGGAISKIIAEGLDESSSKIESGRVYDPENEAIRQEWHRITQKWIQLRKEITENE